jgi:putative N-acetyltransferase (TIGR04045 family)
MFFDPPTAFLSAAYQCLLATERWQLDGYWRLRREVFCLEQRLFADDEADEHDAGALPIVAVSTMMGMTDRVVGAVRIYTSGPGTWHGSRLAVEREHRGLGRLGAGLVHKAVRTAVGLGCRRFLATVQSQNVPFFRRLHWQSLEPLVLHGWPHELMEADLAWYPPCGLETPIDVALSRRAS